ncbi:Cytochrome bo(3) ubiquinol oxidase subunit 3 [Commensalibacter sp. Nvir]|uniref:cytochrome o ubiquinol oxidase subunit III n=1 Tax=Commensalibacter sp. Nvir TaxID=3069817 RepID=UPI002D6DA1E0|nr:Cytochrome bo(3) ubiquinol oxidase subunit 3 [Commensalibacter sp. Nvir]
MTENIMTVNSVSEEHEHQNHSVFGFWIYLMSDCIIFGCLFASYAVLRFQFAGGPTAKEMFELPGVAMETALLLVSSLTFGFAMIEAYKGKKTGTVFWMIVSAILGAGFLFLEIKEFIYLIAHGASPDVSAFWSTFFTLVSTHGLHVTLGIIWMIVLIVQILLKGINSKMLPRLACLSLFWHFLDIIWICVFSFVYLLSMVP